MRWVLAVVTALSAVWALFVTLPLVEAPRPLTRRERETHPRLN